MKPEELERQSSAVVPEGQLPELRVTLSKKQIIMGAVHSRDWQPIHHDSEYAREQAALPDIIMNNYTQAGWLSRYITDWSGPEARLGRLGFSMLSPLCPGDEAVFSGVIEHRKLRDDFLWLAIAVKIHVGDRLATRASAVLALPSSPGGASPWSCADDAWRPWSPAAD